MDRIRRHIIFFGHVQGVGFRWRASHTAKRYDITGWVRNLDDGTVEMEAEGTERDIDDMIEDLKDHLTYGSIDHVVSKNIPTQGSYSFEIVDS